MKELIYSRNAVYETLSAKRRQIFSIEIAEGVQEKGKIEQILKLAKEQKIKVNRVPRPKLDKVHQNNQGIVAEVSGYPYSDVLEILEHANGELPFMLMLDSLQDPQNFGTLIRTAEALGVHGVVIPSARTVDVTPAVVNASSGASEHMLIAQANLSQTIDALKENDIWVVGLGSGWGGDRSRVTSPQRRAGARRRLRRRRSARPRPQEMRHRFETPDEGQDRITQRRSRGVCRVVSRVFESLVGAT